MTTADANREPIASQSSPDVNDAHATVSTNGVRAYAGSSDDDEHGTHARGSWVKFEVERELSLSPQRAWEELRDWAGHARWVPCTRVEISPEDPNAFVAFTGVGRLALEDRMVMVEEVFDGTHGRCTVEKLGPVLTGTARFSIEPGDGGTSRYEPEAVHAPASAKVTWVEEVRVRYLPGVLAAPAGWVGARLFHLALGRMAKRARS